MRNIMIERTQKDLTKESQNRGQTLQDIAKRLLAGFFGFMFLFTVVSRAADSITVARVGTDHVKSSVLNYEITGDGTTEADSEEYLDLYEGIRIHEVAVREGQSVSKGEVLFTYDRQDLQKQRDSLMNALTTLRLTLEKTQLQAEVGTEVGETQLAQVTLSRARMDLKSAKAELLAAREKNGETKKAQLEAATEVVADASDARLEAEEESDRAILTAEEEVTAAREAWDGLFVKKNKLETALEEYKSAALSSKLTLADLKPVSKDRENPAAASVNSSDSYFSAMVSINESYTWMLERAFAPIEQRTQKDGADTIAQAEAEIFRQYYGEEEYEKHAKEVRQAQKALARAKEDYMLVFLDATENGSLLTTSRKAACIRAYEDADQTLEELTRKDSILSDSILAYGTAVQQKDDALTEKAYGKLLLLLYPEDEDRQKEITAAQKRIDIASDELARTQEEWKRKLQKADRVQSKAKQEQEKQQDEYQQQDQTYENSDEIVSLEKQVESARRAVEDAKTALAKAQLSDARTLAAKQSGEKIRLIDQEVAELEFQEKQEAVDQIKSILGRKGQVCAPASGIVLHCELQVGSKITGAERVSVSTEKYSFFAMATKEEAKHLALGDEIKIQLENTQKEITSTIESIAPADSQGMVKLTALLPEGEYGAGAAASFTIQKRSKKYDQTVPLQAVRMDGNQVNYVLIVEERDTSLGKELTAVRRNVSVLEKDGQTAAIQGTIGPEENIIVSSSKGIEEGDRVRRNEEKQ